jgi:hypothetical protein
MTGPRRREEEIIAANRRLIEMKGWKLIKL